MPKNKVYSFLIFSKCNQILLVTIWFQISWKQTSAIKIINAVVAVVAQDITSTSMIFLQ